ncbi:MAG: hypothetical protein LH679_25200, partial [Cyanobacteria bacterium CAN_BIN43]|nr:hypothetical protein [Cyanobacteria bacterium CAN_BIN43]
TADLVNNASQLEQIAAKLYTTWKRLNTLAERVFVDSGESTPHLRSLLSCLTPLTNSTIEVNLGEEGTAFSHPIRIKILTDDSES